MHASSRTVAWLARATCVYRLSPFSSRGKSGDEAKGRTGMFDNGSSRETNSISKVTLSLAYHGISSWATIGQTSADVLVLPFLVIGLD